MSKGAARLRHTGMRYMILIHSNPNAWDALTEAQQAAIGRGHMDLARSLVDSGELVAGEGLADPSLGKRVAVRDGEVIASDGPFAEVKEHVAGFYVVDVETEARAIEIAAAMPDAQHVPVELRPVLDMEQYDP